MNQTLEQGGNDMGLIGTGYGPHRRGKRHVASDDRAVERDTRAPERGRCLRRRQRMASAHAATAPTRIDAAVETATAGPCNDLDDAETAEAAMVLRGERV